MTSDAPPLFCSISDVERDVGIAKETLRVWERRYGFPAPQRDANGERAYPPDQVHRLVLIKRLLDQGFRPGKVVNLPPESLMSLGARHGAGIPERGLDDPEIAAALELLAAHRNAELRQRLLQSMLQMGMRRCVHELIAPLTTAVGAAWATGRIAVFEEHIYADMVQSVMRNAVLALNQQVAPAGASPRVLLATVPQERHGLGLLMAEAIFCLEGAHCLSLGVQTPLGDIVEAAHAERADIVALSFSAAMSPRTTIENINELNARLAGSAVVWSGGAGAFAARRHVRPGGVLDLTDIAGALARWREEARTARGDG